MSFFQSVYNCVYWNKFASQRLYMSIFNPTGNLVLTTGLKT